MKKFLITSSFICITSLAFAAKENIFVEYRSLPDFREGTGGDGGNINFSSTQMTQFTASGTYTPTSGMKYCIIECVGAGGGGGGAQGGAGGCASAGGGGSGAYTRSIVSAATIGASQTVTIGSGGTGGTTAGTSGSFGTDSSVGSLVICAGGTGGIGDTISTGFNTTLGGAGGTAGSSTGDLIVSGNYGFNGSCIYQGTGLLGQFIMISAGGQGASSFYGAGGQSGNNTNGLNGLPYGSGGGGGSQSGIAAGKTGGNGVNGIIVITEYL